MKLNFHSKNIKLAGNIYRSVVINETETELSFDSVNCNKCIVIISDYNMKSNEIKNKKARMLLCEKLNEVHISLIFSLVL